MSGTEKQLNEMQKGFISVLDDIAVAMVEKDYKKALDIALKTKRELVDDCESYN